MTLITVSSNKSSKLSFSLKIFSFFAVVFFSSTLHSAPSFSLGATKLDLAQPGSNDMLSADFNQDNIDDVIISEYLAGDGTAAIELRLGDSGGLFDASTTLLRLPTGGDGIFFNPGGLDVGLFNGDAILDVAITAGLTPESGANPTQPENLQTYIFSGILVNGRYSLNRVTPVTVQTVYPPVDVALGDFNNDSIMDVVIAHTRGISLFLGTATGIVSTTEKFIVTTGRTLAPSEIYLRDLNGDGFVDIVTDRNVYFNNNTAVNKTLNSVTKKVNYTTILSATGKTSIASVAIADFNADSILDLAYALNNRLTSTSQIVTMLSSGTGTAISYSQSTIPQLNNSTLSDITVADLDLDGINDIIVSDDKQSVIHVYTGLGGGSFVTPVSSSIIPTTALAIPPLPKFVEVLKVNNDNLLDIVTANDSSSGPITPTFSVLSQNPLVMQSFVFGPNSYSVPKPALTSANLPMTILRKYSNQTATTISYSVVEGTARNGTDFTASQGVTNVNFAAGDLSQIINIMILPTATMGKSFTVALSDSAGALVDTATITIQGSEAAVPIISLTSNSYQRFEDQGQIIIRVTARRTPVTTNTTTSVYLTTQELTGPSAATKNLDYTAITRQSLTQPNLVFTGKQTVTNLQIPLTIINDSLVEGTESFNVSLSSPVNGILSATNSSATVIIIDNDLVATGNAIPVANSDTYSTLKNTLLIIDVTTGLIQNDRDAEGSNLTARLAPGSTVAGLILAANGSFRYQPVLNFSGIVTFNYIVNDGTDDSAPATVTITVTNPKPKANSDNFSTQMNTNLTIPAPGVLSNDSDANNSNLTSRLAPGSSLVGLSFNQDGSLSYMPATDVTGKVSFQYINNNGSMDSLAATVTIDVYDPVQLNSGVFSFSTVNSYSVSEQRSELILFVVRDSGSTGVVTLNYSLKDITATNGADYNDKTKTVNTLVFNEGVTSLSIILGIVGDSLLEQDEEFLISLESVSSGVLANSNISRKVIITDSSIPISSSPSNNNGGGGCTLQSNSKIDPILPLLVLLSVLYFTRRRLTKQG